MTLPMRLLYAEDDARDADLTQAHLAREAPDIALHLVATGQACLEALQRDNYDLLLLDNRLPDLDGLDVLKALVQQGMALPVVMVTGVGDEDLVVQALRMGAANYIVKQRDYLDSLPALLRQAVADFRRKQADGEAVSFVHRAVLYIEDDTMDIDLTQRHFAKMAPHFTIDVVTSTAEALERLVPDHRFDVILADLDMPDMNALELLQELQQRRIETPVVVVTGKGGEEAAIASLRQGGYDYIVKRDNYRSKLPYALEHAIARYQLDVVNKRLLNQWEDLNRSLEAKIEARTADLVKEVAERRQAVAALRASEERFAKAFRSSPDAIIITRLKDDILVEANDGFEALSGYRAEEALGRSTLDLDLWPDPARRTAFIQRAREQGWVRNFEAKIRDRSGQSRICMFAAEIIELDDEDHVLIVSRDITEHKRTEAEREQLIAQLEAKNAELARFTYTVSHDLKTPLVTIGGFLGQLEQDALAGNIPQLKNDIKFIKNATETMGRLLRELLELSRVGRLVNPPEPALLSDLAHEAAVLVAGLLRAHNVTIEIAETMPPVYVDRVRIVEVLQNLIDNAAKFIGSQPEPHIWIDARIDGEMIRCCVRDNGVGIAPEYQEKIFGLFEQLDPRIEGTGIGLALARRIVEVHGGTLHVNSDGLGHGSTFTFTLPGLPPSLSGAVVV